MGARESGKKICHQALSQKKGKRGLGKVSLYTISKFQNNPPHSFRILFELQSQLVVVFFKRKKNPMTQSCFPLPPPFFAAKGEGGGEEDCSSGIWNQADLRNGLFRREGEGRFLFYDYHISPLFRLNCCARVENFELNFYCFLRN